MRTLLVVGVLALILASPGYAASILFVGNSFTYGELSPVEHYQPDSVNDLNHEGIGGVPAVFKAFTVEAHLDYAGRLARMFEAKNPRVDIRLVSTWSRADQTYLRSGHWYGKPIDVMANDIRMAYNQAATTSPAIHSVIPVGQAWSRAIASEVAAETLAADHRNTDN